MMDNLLVFIFGLITGVLILGFAMGHKTHKKRCGGTADPDPLQKLKNRRQEFLRKVQILMASIDDVVAAVQAESDEDDSVIAFIAGLKQQLADALAGTTLPPATQAKVDAIFAQATANAGKLATAITTPPAP